MKLWLLSWSILTFSLQVDSKLQNVNQKVSKQLKDVEQKLIKENQTVSLTDVVEIKKNFMYC